MDTNTNINIYEYDKYDIIDFLEPEYIDWLNSIPNKCWTKYKKDIEKSFCKLTNELIMDLVMTKVKINLPKYVIDNFENITLEILKYCVKINFTKLKELMSDYKLNSCINVSINKKDLYFNKYFYEDLYFNLKPTHQYLEQNKSDKFMLCKDIYIHKDNIFYNTINSDSMGVTNYDLIKYFNKMFPNIFHNIHSFDNKNYLYVKTFRQSKINNWNDLIELKNILNISDNVISKKILIGEVDSWMYHENSEYLLVEICKLGNVELVFKTINYFWSPELLKIDNIINIMTISSLSKNYELVFLLYNFYTYEKNIKFDENTCSHIVNKIIKLSDKKYHEYDKILYEWFNLGGIVKGYGVYTDYIESIKIKKNK